MRDHTHQYTMADDEAVKVLLDKLLSTGSHQQRRKKLLKALEEASRRYYGTTVKERKAFFHGLLTATRSPLNCGNPALGAENSP